MPPRPSNPATRYRPARMVPGRNRPSSTLAEELRCGAEGDAEAPISSVSAEVASRRAAHHEQKLPPLLSRLQEGHKTVMARLASGNRKRTSTSLFWQRVRAGASGPAGRAERTRPRARSE